jgi:hypothetical protein
MRRAIATAAALGAVLVASAGAAPASDGAACPNVVTWRATAYKSVATRGEIPLGRLLGKGRLRSSCRETNSAAGGARTAAADIVLRRRLYAVDGLRPQLAVATTGGRPSLYVSRTPATAAELRVLRRLRGD